MTAPQQHHSALVPVPSRDMEALQFVNSSGVVSSTTKGKRSKRPRHAIHALHYWAEDEAPCSSLSEEEDLANCLVMLSNGQPTSGSPFGPSEAPPDMPSSNSDRNFQCKTCNRNFHSYQALGGHSASHSKFKSPALQHDFADDSDDEEPKPERVRWHSPEAKRSHRARAKIHECSVCHRIFPTGQALGGHKRSHSAPSAASHTSATAGSTTEQQAPLMSRLLDLNMPPPVDEEDECVRMDDSALSYSLGGDVEDSHWSGPGCKMSPYFTPPWWVHGTKEVALFRYSDGADASSAADSGMLGGQDLDFQQGSVLVATVN